MPVRPHLDRQSFIFASPPPSPAGVAHGARVLGIRTLRVAAPFEGRAFVYRTGEFSYDRDPYAQFMVPPAEGPSSPICSWMREAGGFREVAEAGSALKPDTLVEIHVRQLYGDFRRLENPAAVLAIRFVFFDAPDGVPGKVILRRDYSRNIPLKARNGLRSHRRLESGAGRDSRFGHAGCWTTCCRRSQAVRTETTGQFPGSITRPLEEAGREHATSA